jgi:NDP-sugar pyrophosphorylase family protein
MEVVVMAAGEGRRLRPITEHWPKPVLPIDGRPVLAVLLRELGRSALGPVTIVVGHLADQVMTLADDGGAFDVDVRFVRQPEALGSADAIRRAMDAGVAPPFVVLAADTVFSPGDVGRFVDAAGAAATAGALAVRARAGRAASRPGVRTADGLVEALVDSDPALTLTSSPLWLLRPELAPFLDDLPGPPHELKDAYQRAIDSGLRVAAVPVRATRDLTHPEDLMVGNFPYLRP